MSVSDLRSVATSRREQGVETDCPGACRCSALFAILQRTTADLRELSAADLAERAKYAELVMKVRGKAGQMRGC